MPDHVIATETDTQGQEIKIFNCTALVGSPVYTFYLKNFVELIENGHAYPHIASTNRTKAIYATINGEVVGNIIYDFDDETKKVTYLIFSCVDKNYRRRGILKIMHRYFEETIKKAGSVSLYSFVHRDNAARIASCKSLGLEPIVLKMIKKLV